MAKRDDGRAWHPQHGSLSAENGSGRVLHQTGFAGCESPGFAPANLLQQLEPVRQTSERNRQHLSC